MSPEDFSVAPCLKEVVKHFGKDTCQLQLFLQQTRVLPGAFSTNCLLPPSSKTCQGILHVGNNSLLSGIVFLSLGLKGLISMNLGEIPSQY